MELVVDRYCRIADCEDPNNPGFPRPSFRDGVCSSHTKQLQRTGKTSPIAEQLSPTEKLLDAAARWVETDAEDDEAFERNRRAVVTAAFGLVAKGSQANARQLARLAVVDRRIQLADRLSRRASALSRRFTASARRLEELAARTAEAA